MDNVLVWKEKRADNPVRIVRADKFSMQGKIERRRASGKC